MRCAGERGSGEPPRGLRTMEGGAVRGRMAKLLVGQAALVTGASSGIGLASALALGAAGAKVAVNYRSQREEAEQAVRVIEEGGGEAFAIQGDVSSESDVEAMIARTIERFGTIDLLVKHAVI